MQLKNYLLVINNMIKIFNQIWHIEKIEINLCISTMIFKEYYYQEYEIKIM